MQAQKESVTLKSYEYFDRQIMISLPSKLDEYDDRGQENAVPYTGQCRT